MTPNRITHTHQNATDIQGTTNHLLYNPKNEKKSFRNFPYEHKSHPKPILIAILSSISYS